MGCHNLPEGIKVHPTFHVSQLKAFTPDYSLVHTVMLHIPQPDVSDVAPESILDRRREKKGNEAISQILVKWIGLPDESSTWKDYHVLEIFGGSSLGIGCISRWGKCHHQHLRRRQRLKTHERLKRKEIEPRHVMKRPTRLAT
jgi:hypothetical protein